MHSGRFRAVGRSRWMLVLMLLSVAMTMMLGLSACDHGLTPDVPVQPGFGGTIRVVSAWPPADSVVMLIVVAFRDYPPKNILEEVLANRAVFSEALVKNATTQRYRIEKDALAGSFAYVAVAWQHGPRIEADWRAAGVYTLTGDPNQPAPITITPGRFIDGVDITVDFDHLPPQPF